MKMKYEINKSHKFITNSTCEGHPFIDWEEKQERWLKKNFKELVHRL